MNFYDRDQAFGGSQLTLLISRNFGLTFDEAERKTATTCEMCGSSGGLHCRKGVYWVRTLCPAHAEEYDYEPYRNEDHDF